MWLFLLHFQIHPDLPGNTPVIVPRLHLSSDIFSLKDTDYEKLIEAAYKVTTLIKTALSVESACMIFEGFEIDYAHIKLIPFFKQNRNLQTKQLQIFIQNIWVM